MNSLKSLCFTQSCEPMGTNPPKAEAENTAGSSAGGNFQRARGPCPGSDTSTVPLLSPARLSPLSPRSREGQRGSAQDLAGSGRRTIPARTLPLRELPAPLAAANLLQAPQLIYECTRFHLVTYSPGISSSLARCERILRAHILISLSIASSCCSKLMKIS